MNSYEKARYIAEKVSELSKNHAIISACDILEKCKNNEELNWWYRKIKGDKNDIL